MREIVRETPAEELAPAPQRRAEALAELARRFLDSPHAPMDHGNRPHLTVVVDWQVLTGEWPGGLSELLDGTVITPAHARRLACDALACRLLAGPSGEMLDLGRSQRPVTSAQWKALRIRDRHCQWPGCTRPWTWCDAHHIRHRIRHLGTHRPGQSHLDLPPSPHPYPPRWMGAERDTRRPQHHPTRRHSSPQRPALARLHRSIRSGPELVSPLVVVAV